MKYLCIAYEEEQKLNDLSKSEWLALRQETLDYVETLRKRGLLIITHAFHSWPPVWACTGGVKNQRPKGEVGILRKIILSRVHPTQRCYLEIDHEGSKYMGCLIIDDHAFCAQIVQLLQDSCNRPIAEIGSLDISHLL